MKPKYSTGYLTPQDKGKKQFSKAGTSDADSGAMSQINNSIYEKIMSCPLKRKLVLSLIASEKDNIEEYKQNLAKQQKSNDNSGSPLRRIQKKHQCESPTALLRRRALEQQNQNSLAENNSDSHSDNSGSRTSSRQSVVSQSPVSFDKLLDGVIAYVEIRSRDQDRSTGVKALTGSMGAVVRDTFTRDVTHVIFKDGSFTTYQKANLMKIHLVSVLWLEACKNSGTKVTESKFPALGTDAYDHNVSKICSQMQKEYEEIIREEYRRSFKTGTPLPTTKSLIERRRTIMNPNVSKKVDGYCSSQDEEVADIFSQGRRSENFTGKIRRETESSDDDSDAVALINGNIINTKRKDIQIADLSLDVQTSNTCIRDDTMDFTTLATEESEHSFKVKEVPETPDGIYNEKTPKIGSSNVKKIIRAEKDHACITKVISERRSITPAKNNNTSDRVSLKSFSPKVQILSKNVSVASPRMVKDHTTSSMSALELSSDTKKTSVEKSTSTNMSSLQISSKISDATIMSSLQISNQSEKTNKRHSAPKKTNSRRKSANDNKSFNSAKSFSPLQEEVVDSLLSLLDDKLEKNNITTRKRLVSKGTQEGKSPPKKSRIQRSMEKNTRRKTIHSLSTKSSPLKSANSAESSGNECYNNRRVRRLYNPDDSLANTEVCDEKEREKKRMKAKAADFDKGVFIRAKIVPVKTNVMVSEKALEFIEKHHLNIDNILNEKSGDVQKKNAEQDKPPEKQSTNTDKQKESAKGRRKLEDTSDTDTTSSESSAEEKIETSRINRKAPITRSTTRLSNIGPSRRRCSARLSRPVLEKINLNTSSSSEEVELPQGRNRRSSLEFQAKSKKKILKIDKVKKPVIVCTKMHKEDIQIFSQIVKKLGVFVIEDEVTSKTTHLVAGEPKRTINMLRAMANGCWIVKKEWLFKSLEATKWLPEEDFEETVFSPVVQKSRMQRQAFGPTYSMDIFRDCPPIYVAKDTIPRCSDLRGLVTWCQGKDVPSARRAGIVIGELVNHEGVTCVTVSWLLDSITFGKKMPFRKYLHQSNRCSIAV